MAAARLPSSFPRGNELRRVGLDNPAPPQPDFSEGIDGPALIVIERGEAGLTDIRNNSIARWIAAGAAWKTLQLLAMRRSNSNRPSGRRYSAVYAMLVYRYPGLARADKGTRSNAVWLFERSERDDPLMRWLQNLPQTQRDRWVHPTTVRRHFEGRFPVIDAKPARRRPRIKTVLREWDRQRLGEISREDLEAIVGRLADQLADRDAEISALNDDLAERDREIARLKNELDWETAERRQLESLYRPAPND